MREANSDFGILMFNHFTFEVFAPYIVLWLCLLPLHPGQNDNKIIPLLPLSVFGVWNARIFYHYCLSCPFTLYVQQIQLNGRLYLVYNKIHIQCISTFGNTLEWSAGLVFLSFPSATYWQLQIRCHKMIIKMIIKNRQWPSSSMFSSSSSSRLLVFSVCNVLTA